MLKVEIVGIDEIIKALDDIGSKSVQRNTIISLGRKALRPSMTAAKAILRSAAATAKNFNGFSRLGHVAKNIKIIPSKSKVLPGVNMYVKGTDIPVHNEWWNIGGWVALLVFGSYKKGERFHKSGKSTGKFLGFGNFLYKGFRNTYGLVRQIFFTGVKKHLEKNVQKAITRYGRK